MPDWEESERAVGCFGSGGMAECIADVPGTIGYLDAEFGIAGGLSEVRLPNSDDSTVFRTSAESSIEDAITINALPGSPDADFSAVSFLNQPGSMTWPIVQMTYLYVRKDLSSFMDDPQEQALLIGFLRALYMPEYMERCAELYGFTLFYNSEVLQYAQDAIDLVEESVDSNATKFEFETSGETRPIEGAREYVFSSRRREIADIERADLMVEVAVLKDQLAQTILEVEAIKLSLQQPQDDDTAVFNCSQCTASPSTARNTMVKDPTTVAPAVTAAAPPTSSGSSSRQLQALCVSSTGFLALLQTITILWTVTL